jgi:glycosyltransferase involved in cell wall biosynthesis
MTNPADGPDSGSSWHILTGEYPPQTGGISDYTYAVASKLAEDGSEVHIWAPPAPGLTPDVPGVTVHRAAGSWSRADLNALDDGLDRFPAPRRLVVQYTPNAFLKKGMNVGFCRWLLRRRRRGDNVWVMFHEVRYTPVPGDRLARRMLVPVQSWMVRTLLQASTRVLVSIPGWAEMLREISPRSMTPIVWAPVPSNVPAVDDPSGVAAIRSRYAPDGLTLIGTFGTFREYIRPILLGVYPALLAHPGRVLLLIGRNSQAFADMLLADHPALAGRVFATGGLPGEDIARHLQACDLLIQPDTGGVCTKQGTTMAGLSQGRPLVVGAGRLTEPVWSEERCVALAPSPSPADLIQAAESCLADPAERARLGEAARSAYARHFSIERTVEVLTGVTAASGSGRL